MIKRDEHYRKFGPLRAEAADLVMLDYINELRVNQGMAPLTQEDFLVLIENHLSQIEPYDWMKRRTPGE